MFKMANCGLIATSAFKYAVKDAESTLELVQLSIKKWDALVEHMRTEPEHPPSDGGADTCACCQGLDGGFCKLCPLGSDVGDPRRDFYDAWMRNPSLETARKMRTALVVQAMKLRREQ